MNKRDFIFALVAVIFVAANGVYAHRDWLDTVNGSALVVKVENATPAAPHACDAAHTGAIVYVDDTNDNAASAYCFCGKTNDSTFDWLDINAVSLVTGLSITCPFF